MKICEAKICLWSKENMDLPQIAHDPCPDLLGSSAFPPVRSPAGAPAAPFSHFGAFFVLVPGPIGSRLAFALRFALIIHLTAYTALFAIALLGRALLQCAFLRGNVAVFLRAVSENCVDCGLRASLERSVPGPARAARCRRRRRHAAPRLSRAVRPRVRCRAVRYGNDIFFFHPLNRMA